MICAYLQSYCVCLCRWGGMQVPYCVCLEGLRRADRSQFSLSTGVLRFQHRLLGVGTDSLYSLSHLGTPLFKMCCVYAGLCICRVQMHECVYVQQRVCGTQKTALALCYPQILWGWHSSLCAQVVPLYQPSRPQHYVSFCHSGFQRSHLLFILL